MSEIRSGEIVICNRKGLHARAAAALAREALQFNSRILVRHEEAVADGRSIMDLLMLTAHMGCTVMVTAEGDDAEDALAGVLTLIGNRFGEAD